MTNDQQKTPSELSLEIFATSVAADEALPLTVRAAVNAHKEKKVNELLAAIKRAIGDIR